MIIDSIKTILHSLVAQDRTFFLSVILVIVRVLFFLYLMMALVIHRADRKRLENRASKTGKARINYVE